MTGTPQDKFAYFSHIGVWLSELIYYQINKMFDWEKATI